MARSKKAVVKSARVLGPKSKLLKHRTSNYQAFDWDNDRDFVASAPPFYRTHDIYLKHGFKLVTGRPPPGFTLDKLLRSGLRLDDMYIGIVCTYYFDKNFLKKYFPSEFDSDAMVRAQRVALGEACLVWVEMGQLDIYGNPAPADGCYYGWYRGLQLLCGDKEMWRRIKMGTYLIRPSHEAELCDGITFKITDPAPGTKQDALLKAESRIGDVAVVVAMHDYLP